MACESNSSNDCLAIAFYGISANPQSLSSFYTNLVNFFNSLGCQPDKASVSAPGFSNRLTGFLRADAKLQKRGFSDVNGIEIYSLSTPTSTDEYRATSYLYFGHQACFALEVRTSVILFEDKRLNQLIESSLEHLNPHYGIGYFRQQNRGPLFYALGVNFTCEINYNETPEEYEEKLTISRWADIGMEEEIYKKGFLRDIYPYNYLSESQLSYKIGNQTLREWILTQPDRGNLIPTTGRLTLWKVSLPQISSIQKNLWPTGILFSWKSYL